MWYNLYYNNYTKEVAEDMGHHSLDDAIASAFERGFFIVWVGRFRVTLKEYD